MSRYRLSRTAKSDIREIWAYVAKDRPTAADRLIDRLYEKFRMASMHPLTGEARNDLAPGLRIFSVGNYVVVFRAIAGGIEVVRVVHGARELHRLF
jgi:toxin ParE1/3/4